MTTPYFGPESARKDWEHLIDTPVGEPCLHCDEAILPGDVGTIQTVVDTHSVKRLPIHYVCSMRSVIGSLAHVEQRCSCFIAGADEGDPPGMTRYEAAAAAVRAWERMQR